MPLPVVSVFQSDYAAAVRQAADVLRGGGIAILPTETVYGAAGLLRHPDARRRLHELRGSPDAGPFTIHLAEPEDAPRYLGAVNEFGRRLMRKLWPGPVSLVFAVPAADRQRIAGEQGLAESELFDANGDVTLRCPNHIATQDVIGLVDGDGGPVVLTRAPTGTSVPGPAMAAELEGKADLILDAGPTRYSQASTILKVGPERYEIVREGIFDARIIERLLRTTILFVCSGNTCRSPMAEALARRLLAEKAGVTEPELEKRGISVQSAGAFAMPGSRATPQAVDAVRDLGGDLSRHRSQPLTVELIHQADLIYTMGRGHAAAVTALVPSATDKVATLDPRGDIDDPIGGDLHLYQDLAKQLRGLIERRLDDRKLLGAVG